jgi:hypothetical protein
VTKEFTARFCTGKCRVDVMPVVSLSLAAAIALVVFGVICARIVVWSCPTPLPARFRRRRAYAASYSTYGGIYDDLDDQSGDTVLRDPLRDPLLQTHNNNGNTENLQY